MNGSRSHHEDWLVFIRRATREAEHRMHELGFESWAKGHWRRKWKFAGKTLQGSENTWSRRLLEWKPHFRCFPKRCVGRPRVRWEDALVDLVGGEWTAVARDEHLWN